MIPHGFKASVARRELRKWLRESKEGKAVERVVGRLLGEGGCCGVNEG